MRDDIVKALDALGEDDFYYRPATTKAMIDKAAAEIAHLRAAIATAQVTALKKAADIARQFAQSEGWSGASALRLRNCIIAEAAVYAKTGAKNE